MSYEVPNPYVVTTHPYPAPATGGKGGSWTRPVFGFPYQRSVQSVFKPDDFNDGNPGLRGLGTDFNVGNGVFGTARQGGGVFGPSLYGLGDNAEDIDAIARSILSTSTKSTAAFDIQNEFRAWYDGLSWFGKDEDAMAKAVSYRSRFNAANVAGGGSAPAAAPPASSAAQPLTEAGIKAVQQTLSSALVSAGYNPIGVDGKVGAGTCGAIQWYQQKVNPAAGTQFAAICAAKKPWTAPSKKSSGGGTYTPPPVEIPAEPLQAGMGASGSTWAMIGGGALAIALAVVGKKKGWF